MNECIAPNKLSVFLYIVVGNYSDSLSINEISQMIILSVALCSVQKEIIQLLCNFIILRWSI